MRISFITGNSMKMREIGEIIPGLEQCDVDLPEMQSLNPQEVLATKVEAAMRKGIPAPFMVEDTSLHLDCLNGFPGPFIKWLLAAVKAQGVYEIARLHGSLNATGRAIIGYVSPDGRTRFFEGTVRGMLAPAVRETGNWDPIFVPEGSDRTFLEMGHTAKQRVSHRASAVRKLKTFLDSNI